MQREKNPYYEWKISALRIIKTGGISLLVGGLVTFLVGREFLTTAESTQILESTELILGALVVTLSSSHGMVAGFLNWLKHSKREI